MLSVKSPSSAPASLNGQPRNLSEKKKIEQGCKVWCCRWCDRYPHFQTVYKAETRSARMNGQKLRQSSRSRPTTFRCDFAAQPGNWAEVMLVAKLNRIGGFGDFCGG
jgi:hypothetical protein